MQRLLPLFVWPKHNTAKQLSKLLELNDELENYFANTIIPQLFVDSELRLRKFTPPAMKQFNLKQEFIGRSLKDVSENFRYPTILENITIVMETGEILEKEIQTTDLKWYQMNILPYIRRQDKKPNGVIITFVDITARIRDLKEQEKLIAEHEILLDTIAHDIKNPLNAINLTIQLIRRLPDQQMDRLPRAFGNLENAVIDMKRVVEGLLDNRLQQHRYQASAELIDMESILDDVKLTLAPQILEREAKIIDVFEAKEIYFVRRKMRSVLFNLLYNAISYTPIKKIPKITVKSKIVDGNFILTVADNGIGISPQHKEAIFKKFERINHDVPGSGVGLYLVSTIVKSAGGKVIVESEAGKGATFQIIIPSPALPTNTPDNG
ncbi:MAG: ATP-binding protein [Bacteroidia bacterium]